MLKEQLLIIFVVFWSQQSSCFIENFFQLAKSAGKLIKILNDVKTSKDTALDIVSILTGDDSQMQKAIVEKLKKIDEDIDELKTYTKTKLDNIEALITGLPDEVEIRGRKLDLSLFIATTDEKWDKLLQYMKMERSREIYEFFASGVLESIGTDLTKFRNIITPRPVIKIIDLGFLGLLTKAGNEQINMLCNEGETYQHIVVRLYQTIMITETKAHILLHFANQIKFPEKDAWKGEVQILNEKFRKQFNTYIQQFERVFRNPQRPYIRTCDPNPWRSGENFFGFDAFFQQTIYTRSESCPIIGPQCPMAGEQTSSCSMSPTTAHTKCSGNISDCVNLFHKWSATHICLWREGQYRIRYITEEGVTKGTDIENTCPNGDKYINPGNVYTGSGTGDYCSCRCTTTIWKLVNQLMPSRIQNNYVIVGMRFNRILHYVYIQIAEGKLEANGYISDFKWVKPIRKMLTKSPHHGFVSLEMSRRAFFFDDLQLPPGHILTAVQFVSTTRHGIDGFVIGVYGVKFDYATGKLNLTQESFVESSNNITKQELTYKTKRSTAMDRYVRHSPDSDAYSHIYLRQSDLHDDYGQSTLPFLDSVPIVTNPLSPIGGVGFFHKGYGGYAGFFSLRLYPIDYLYFIETFVETHNVTAAWDD